MGTPISGRVRSPNCALRGRAWRVGEGRAVDRRGRLNGSSDPYRKHRDRSALHALHGEVEGIPVLQGAEHVEERKVVVRRRDGEPRVGAEGLVVEERRDVTLLHERTGALLETDRPVEGTGLVASPRVEAQVVHDVAAPEDQDAFVAQRSELPAQLVVEGGRLRGVDRELYDGNVRPGVRVPQDRPRAVVEPPRVLEPDRYGTEQTLHAARERGIPGRGVLDVVQLSGEAVEVVNGRRQIVDRDGGEGDVPVRGDGEDRVRRRDLFAEPAPGARPGVVLERIERIAVAEEERRHARCHRTAFRGVPGTPAAPAGRRRRAGGAVRCFTASRRTAGRPSLRFARGRRSGSRSAARSLAVSRRAVLGARGGLLTGELVGLGRVYRTERAGGQGWQVVGLDLGAGARAADRLLQDSQAVVALDRPRAGAARHGARITAIALLSGPRRAARSRAASVVARDEDFLGEDGAEGAGQDQECDRYAGDLHERSSSDTRGRVHFGAGGSTLWPRRPRPHSALS